MNALIKCPICHGDGYEIVGTGYADEYGEEYLTQEVCRHCGGSGEVL